MYNLPLNTWADGSAVYRSLTKGWLRNLAGSMEGSATSGAGADDAAAVAVGSGADLSWHPRIKATLLIKLAARSCFCNVIGLLSLAGL